VSLDPERTWFRYHHLFADLLRLELRRTLPEHVPALHRRAAGWFAQHGHVVEAIRHTQAADDWHDAARLLADHSFGLTLDGQVQTIQALLQAFPPGASADPELALVRAGVDLVQGRLDEAAAHLAALDDERADSGEVGNARAMICLAGGDPPGRSPRPGPPRNWWPAWPGAAASTPTWRSPRPRPRTPTAGGG
jgi:ATP/maltotriose-dependent transcriptional regulator MalT